MILQHFLSEARGNELFLRLSPVFGKVDLFRTDVNGKLSETHMNLSKTCKEKVPRLRISFDFSGFGMGDGQMIPEKIAIFSFGRVPVSGVMQ